MIIRSIIHLTIPVLLGLGFWACGGGQATPPPAISVTLNTHAVNVHVTRSALLTATVHNSTNSAVHWSVTGTGCTGTACGTISSAGLYTAPASVPMPATVTVKATSVADGSKSDSATITILAAVVVTVSPANPSIDLGATLQFSASLQNAIDSSVTWRVSGTGCTGTECGTISTTGLYAAPSDASTILTITITATSVEDPAISQSVTATIVSHAWTWVSGSNFVSQGGIYGTKGIADSANAPGGRHAAVSWIDSSGNLWLFGGVGLDSVGSNSRLNDLWKYDPTTNQWTWVSGSNSVAQTGAYGALGVANPANVPGARWSAVSWIDPQGKFWLFGGLCIDSAGNQGLQNDLWKYDPVTNEWTWVSGSSIVHQAGIYGTKGTADSSNVPGARNFAVAGIDSSGKLWLFGGVGLDSAGNYGVVNDLWRYTR